MRTKRLGARYLILLMSVLIAGAGTFSAQADEPGPFEKFFRAMRRGFNEPQHKSSAQRVKHKKTSDTGSPAATADESPSPGSSSSSSSSTVGKPPNEKNTRGTSRAVTKKGEDLPYGTPVPGKTGFVTSPFSPNSGYIDVRGFAPGTPVKDPYTGKVFLTP
jgi:hypothetical protein